jgi:hypothetical protein
MLHCMRRCNVVATVLLSTLLQTDRVSGSFFRTDGRKPEEMPLSRVKSRHSDMPHTKTNSGRADSSKNCRSSVRKTKRTKCVAQSWRGITWHNVVPRSLFDFVCHFCSRNENSSQAREKVSLRLHHHLSRCISISSP